MKNNSYIRFLYSPFFYIPVVICVFVFDFSYFRKIEEFNTPGIAGLYVPEDIAFPNFNMIDEVFLSSIERFPKAKTIVVVSNSTAMAAGTKDRQFFNTRLNQFGFNVINSALAGQYISSSMGIATAAVLRAIQKDVSEKFDLFIIYNGYRFYVSHTHNKMGSTIASLCENNELKKYIYDCDSVQSNSFLEDIRIDAERYLLGNMRCILSPDFIYRWADRKSIYCDKVFSLEEPNFPYLNSNADFFEIVDVKPYLYEASQKQSVINSYKFLNKSEDSVFRKSLATFMEKNRIIYAIDTIVDEATMMENLIKAYNIPYNIHFLLLGDETTVIQNLTRDEFDLYLEGRKAIVEGIKAKKPHWNAVNLLPFPENEYRDVGHFNAQGQAKLAAIINYYSKLGPVISEVVNL